MPQFNLVNDADGALIRGPENHETRPADLPGKGWVWLPHAEPIRAAGQIRQWDAVTRAHIAAGMPAGSIDARAAELTAEVKRQAEAERLKHLTPGAGKANEYRRKEEEARAWDAAGGGTVTTPTNYPFANARAAVTGETIEDVLALFKARSDAWAALGAQIAAAEDGAVLDIEAARVAGDWVVLEAAGYVTWPTAA
jgi:hypothetical protein